MADGDLHLSESPNVDTGLVEKDGSLHRTVLTAVPEGTLQLSDSANVSTGYVTDSDGKKHKVNLVAEVTGSLELSDNPSVDTGYVTDGDGKKHKVKLTASLHGGGSAPVIDELNVTPSTSAQTITAPEGTDGYSPVNVSAVTSAIDANIVAGNIKNGVSILGVIGDYTGGAPAHYIEKAVDANGKLLNSSNFIDLTGVTDIGENALKAAYINNTLLTSVNMGSVTKISGNNALQDCCLFTSVTTVNFSPVQEISGNQVFRSTFSFCGSLQSVDANTITTISGNAPFYETFTNCGNLRTVSFNGLNVLLYPISDYWGHMFDNNCKKLEDVYFGGLTSSTFISRQDQLSYLFSAQTAQNAPNGCTVHFPSNFDPSDPNHTFDASTLTGYPTFGGSASYIHVAFDLPATES